MNEMDLAEPFVKIDLTKREADFIASALLRLHRQCVFSPEQDKEAKKIVDRFADLF